MTKIKDFFRMIKWWEYAYLSIYFIVVLSIGIVFKSGAIVICNAVFAVLSNFFVAKGMPVGNILGILNLCFYCTNCVFNQFYGEIVCLAIITFPSYCLSLFTWIKSQKKGSQVLSVNRGLGKLEWILASVIAFALAFGIYFLLKTFGTANLIVSTIATTVGMFAGYLIIRRCEFNFLFYIFTNIVCIILWASSMSQESLINLPIVCAYMMFLITNSFGLFNWIRLKKKQNEENDNVAKMLEICKNDLK